MANSYHHALSSVQKWGGEVGDYLPIHHWFDASKAFMGNFRHRALRHHAQGIFECEERFGNTIVNASGRIVPVRLIAEQHVKEDCGFIPSMEDWFKHISNCEEWMFKAQKVHLEGEEKK